LERGNKELARVRWCPELDRVFIGQISCSIGTMVKCYKHHTYLEHPDKSTMAKHSISLSHHVQLQDTTIHSTKSRYMKQMIREAVKIELYQKNMNRKVGLHLSWSWKYSSSLSKNIGSIQYSIDSLSLATRPSLCPLQDTTWPWSVPYFLSNISYYVICFLPTFPSLSFSSCPPALPCVQ
jgi:hypothetical protein